ncbi:G2/mitotic-specific cyclin-B3-like [Saccostrea echinata]|uniref:G2/mitotic-specific cyclin-B3-like n=1 Tax=Saccostrea echinata TaxID=191078 RepID=UPI002A83CF85|nr:G2/mitotic-specific cyclin-B3-like [Saccostrea echinata]
MHRRGTMNTKKSKGTSLLDVRKSKSGTSTLSQIHKDAQKPFLNVLGNLNGNKRQGDNMMDQKQKRRAAFGDITNAINENNIQKKDILKKTKPPTGVGGKATKKKSEKKRTVKTENTDPTQEDSVPLSQGSVVSSSQDSVSSNSSSKGSLTDLSQISTVSEEDEREIVPESVDDVDTENLQDTAQCALYAPFIFRYYKERELKFMVPMYMDTQPTLTTNMRAILVDWLVEVQENFELNHETLYLAVKLVDTYLSVRQVPKENLQLVGAVSLFVACKFDERCPPLIEDFLYICDDAYRRTEFLEMERSILKTVGFDIGMPLSYRFLRRYAKCARASMETLTMARFILEMSLMEYENIKYRESKMACACLLLAMKMKCAGEWSSTLEYYTGYTAEDLTCLVKDLNAMIASPPKMLTTIKSKYSHRVFYEVAKVPALSEEQLNS